MDSLIPDQPSEDTFQFERMLRSRGFAHIAGADEAGRGPLAGPVVGAAVILPPDCDYSPFCDSKQTTEKQRYLLRDHLLNIGAKVGTGIVSAETIDAINILQASLLAMKQAVDEIARTASQPDFILVDGRQELHLQTPQEALVKGDARSASIGAASIVAKILRDEIMAELHERHPAYNFIANKGYPTAQHRRIINEVGPCPEHRFSFKGVKEFVKVTDRSR